MTIKTGACVKIPDNRIGRVRDKNKQGEWRIRVKRKTSDTHQFLYFKSNQLKEVTCPAGWMSVAGYNSYIKKTSKSNKKMN
jgi:hypothetical protein